MLELIGREFSRETMEAKEFLKRKGIQYKFIDIDFEEDYFFWIKANKIGGLPVLRKDKEFIVGFKEEFFLQWLQQQT